jgi:hypothetical protein
VGHWGLPCWRQVWAWQEASSARPGLIFFWQVLFYQWFRKKNKLEPQRSMCPTQTLCSPSKREAGLLGIQLFGHPWYPVSG